MTLEDRMIANENRAELVNLAERAVSALERIALAHVELAKYEKARLYREEQDRRDREEP